MFLLETVSIETYIETSSEHLPSLFCVMVTSLQQNFDTISSDNLATCLSTLRKVLARVQPAWNVWDVSEKLNKSRQEITDTEADVAKEATESNPGSPVNIPQHNGDKSDTKDVSVTEHSNDNSLSLSTHETLVRDCKELFLNLFSDLIDKRIIENNKLDWKTLAENRNKHLTNYKGLESLLHQVLRSNELINQNPDECQSTNKVLLKPESEKFSNAFSLACNCILELSSMPKYNNSDNNQINSEECSELPGWLYGLLLCCTASSRSPPASSLSATQLSAITTVVELSTLVIHCNDKTRGHHNNKSGTGLKF